MEHRKDEDLEKRTGEKTVKRNERKLTKEKREGKKEEEM
jgi:hypothetical protein